MRTTIDGAGRVVIPKSLRTRLGLTAGEIVEIRERDGTIELEPAPTVVTLVDTGDGVVAVPERDLPPLSDELVRATLDRTRR